MLREIYALSDTGPVRTQNEDMYLAAGNLGREDRFEVSVADDQPLLVAVADGMGGHPDGEIASRRALELLDEARSNNLLPDQASEHADFTHILSGIHDNLVGGADSGHALKMGATMVGLWLPPGEPPMWFHAGDSRLYRWRDNVLEQLTNDHTMVNEMLRSGRDPGGVSPHIVTSCLGGGMFKPTVDTASASGPIQPEDRFLLCSDGLTEAVSDQQILSILGSGTAQESAEALVQAALTGDARDNITVVVVRVTE